MFDVNIFGANISRLRKQNNMTQSELGDLINVTRQAVSKYENGESFPDVSILVRLSEIFNITLDDLIGAGHPTKNEAEILKTVATDGEIPNELLDNKILNDIVNVAPLLKPNVLDKAAAGLAKFGVDISNVVKLAEYMSDKSVTTLLLNSTYDTLDEELLEKLMPFIDDKSKMTLLTKVIDGELDYHFLRIILPYAEWFSHEFIEAAVVDGALDKRALNILQECSKLFWEKHNDELTII